MSERTVLRNTGDVQPFLVAELALRGGVAEIGERSRPGKDRDIYLVVARRLALTPDELELTGGEICPSIKPGDSRYAKNAWDHTMQVAVNHGRRERLLLASERRGFWELFEVGRLHGAHLLASRSVGPRPGPAVPPQPQPHGANR